MTPAVRPLLRRSFAAHGACPPRSSPPSNRATVAASRERQLDHTAFAASRERDLDRVAVRVVHADHAAVRDVAAARVSDAAHSMVTLQWV